MEIKETNIEGCFLLRPQVFKDGRGTFFESYNKRVFEECIGQRINFVQDNQSISIRGALRGLHFQNGKYAQSKLIRVVKGEILDVIVDLRSQSKTFGQHLKIVLSEHEQRNAIYAKRNGTWLSYP